MPHRKLYRWASRHTMLTVLIIVTLVAGVGYLRLEQIARCGQHYAEATAAANKPIREARTRLDTAEDDVWDAADKVFSQRATQADYDNLRTSINVRDTLTDELAEAYEENPPPDPPSTFC